MKLLRFAVIVFFATEIFARVGHAQSCLTLDSENDFIYKQRAQFDSAMGTFPNYIFPYSRGFSLQYQGLFPGGFFDNWNLTLNDSQNRPITVGNYFPAARFPESPSVHGLDFSGGGVGCNASSGNFTVLDIGYDSQGQLSKIAVDFEQHCENGEGAVIGQYRFNTCGASYPETCVSRLLQTHTQVETQYADVQEKYKALKLTEKNAIKAMRSATLKKCGKRIAVKPSATFEFPSIPEPATTRKDGRANAITPFAEFERCQDRINNYNAVMVELAPLVKQIAKAKSRIIRIKRKTIQDINIKCVK